MSVIEMSDVTSVKLSGYGNVSKISSADGTVRWGSLSDVIRLVPTSGATYTGTLPNLWTDRSGYYGRDGIYIITRAVHTSGSVVERRIVHSWTEYGWDHPDYGEILAMPCNMTIVGFDSDGSYASKETELRIRLTPGYPQSEGHYLFDILYGGTDALIRTANLLNITELYMSVEFIAGSNGTGERGSPKFLVFYPNYDDVWTTIFNFS